MVAELSGAIAAPPGIMDDVATAERILIGRDAELEELSSLLGVRVVPEALREPGSGADGVREHVLLAGDAGVGKTRLLQELGALAATRGWQAYAGHCLDFGDSALPYLPFSEILDRITTQLPDVVERVAHSHPALARLLPAGRSAAPDIRDAAVDRGQLFAAVHALFEAAAEKAPTLVVVEDAHWADQSTRDLLTYLFSRPFAGPVAVVASYRADDLHRRHPLRRQVAEWARLSGVGRLFLDPLGDDDVRALVTTIDPAVRGREREDIVARAEGNAFFVEELVGAAGGPDHWIPDELADVLLVRLDRLDETARSVVRTASVSGRRVGHDLLAAVVGLPAAALDESLRHAVEEHVLVAGEGAYWFRHALLGEAVYDDLLPGERVRLHGRYAAALAGTDGGSALGSAAELARHARLALDLDTALVASVRAGDEAAAVGGPDEAAQHYERALTLLGERPVPDGVSPAHVVKACVLALTTAGRPERAARIAEEQIDRLPADTPPGERAAILTAAAVSVGLLDNAERDPLELSDRAVELVPDDDLALRARVLADRALVLHWTGRTELAQTAGTEALALAERQDLPAIASAAATTLTALGRTGDPTQLRTSVQAVIDRAVASGAVTAELQGRYLLARSYQEWGEWPAAEAAFRAGVERAEAAGQPWAPYGFEPRHQLAWVLYVVGRWDEAMQLLDVARPGSPPVPYAALDAIRLSIRQARGEKVPRRLHRDVWASDGIVPVFCAGTEMIAAGRAGAPADAITIYDEVVSQLSRAWHPWFDARVRLAAVAVGVLADAMPGLAAAERAALLPDVERLASDGAAVVARRHDDERGWGPEGLAWESRLSAETLRARWLAGADVSADELVGTWRDAEERFAGLGHVIELATVRAVLAGILTATGDNAGAAAVAELARAAARDLGARPLLDRLGAPAARTQPAGTEALTRRETEILTLVADGRTNGEIGKRLFISTKTVSVHVSNILAKLGASGRTEAAAIARRRGLV